MPQISKHFQGRSPSAIRRAQILFAERPDRDQVRCINLAIGNVSRPMHPAMQARMRTLGEPGSPFADGVVKYTASKGLDETRAAFLNIIASTGADTSKLHCSVTDGGSMAMELMILGVCGPASPRPLLLLDPAYGNYVDMARRCAVDTVAFPRALGAQGRFEAPNWPALEAIIEERKPAALVVIPADNPTGQYLSRQDLIDAAKLCVKHDLWIVSDEAYRQLHYTGGPPTSVWTLTEDDVPGISGRRISIESASKVWNACGLRIGALITDSAAFHQKCVAESTANLCSNAIGQHIFGALAAIPHDELATWYQEQRGYYQSMMQGVVAGIRERLPKVIVTTPESALYVVIDVRDDAPAGFDSADFVQDCAERGKVVIAGADTTLLSAPMGGFYAARDDNPGRTQLRLAFVEPPEAMELVPELFTRLYQAYLERA